MRYALCTLLLFATACGGAKKRTSAVDDLDREATLAFADRGPTLHQYVVLTARPTAMQTEAERKAMWATVQGKNPRHAWLAQHIATLPGDYEANLTLDFADLPHPVLPKAALTKLLKGLSAVDRQQAEAAKLGVFVRGDLKGLPEARQIRLAGAAALHIAETYDGIIIDLLARQAWTAPEWAKAIKAPQLGMEHVRLVARKASDGIWLFTRGNPKFGEPDLLMRGVKPDQMAAAQATFKAVHAALLKRGGVRDGTQTLAGKTLTPCAVPAGTFDAECVEIQP
jgi:hypothetical protein